MAGNKDPGKGCVYRAPRNDYEETFRLGANNSKARTPGDTRELVAGHTVGAVGCCRQYAAEGAGQHVLAQRELGLRGRGVSVTRSKHTLGSQVEAWIVQALLSKRAGAAFEFDCQTRQARPLTSFPAAADVTGLATVWNAGPGTAAITGSTACHISDAGLQRWQHAGTSCIPPGTHSECDITTNAVCACRLMPPACCHGRTQ